jgi:hypothetical protein
MTENQKAPQQEKTYSPNARTPALPDDFEVAPAFETIRTLAGSSANAAPPQDFTHKVMRRLAEKAIGFRQSLDDQSRKHRLQVSIRNLLIPASAVEIATCFFLTGFFYLVLGIILHFGLKSLAIDSPAAGWIYYQPHIALLTAMGFAAVGVFLLQNNRLAYRIANLAIICYILLSIVNGVQVRINPATPFSFSGVLCFSAGATILGLFLAVAVNNFRRWASLPTAGTL